jgi:hypothetical protein
MATDDIEVTDPAAKATGVRFPWAAAHHEKLDFGRDDRNVSGMPKVRVRTQGK